MRKLLTLAILALLTLSLATPGVRSQEQIVTQCDGVRAACHAYQDVVWATCRAMGGTLISCHIDSYNAYVSCVLNSNCGLGGD